MLFNTLPLQTEDIIRLIQIIGFASAALAVLAILLLVSLQNNLPHKKALQFLKESQKQEDSKETKEHSQSITEETPPVKTKKQLLAYTVAPDAQNLLLKISVRASEDNNWHISPQQRSNLT